jgi:hypothetical protein
MEHGEEKNAGVIDEPLRNIDRLLRIGLAVFPIQDHFASTYTSLTLDVLKCEIEALTPQPRILCIVSGNWR